MAGGGKRVVDVKRVVGRRLAGLVLELDRYDPLVRADVPDAVHRMRVTIRRLRSNLATFRPLLDRTATDPLRDELKWFAGLLGDARDAEVLRADLIARLSDDPPHLVRGGVTELIDGEVEGRYRDAHLRCVEVMAGERYTALMTRLGELGESPPWAQGPDPGDKVLRKRVRHDWNRLDSRVTALASAADDEEHARQLHDVRKAAKRVRYGVEPLVASYGKRAEELADAMAQVQTVLGAHQDAVVAANELLVLSDRAVEKGIDSFELGRLHEREQEEVHAAEAEFEALWTTASRKRYRKWL